VHERPVLQDDANEVLAVIHVSVQLEALAIGVYYWYLRLRPRFQILWIQPCFLIQVVYIKIRMKNHFWCILLGVLDVESEKIRKFHGIKH
jgi:hypothetical protein